MREKKIEMEENEERGKIGKYQSNLDIKQEKGIIHLLPGKTSVKEMKEENQNQNRKREGGKKKRKGKNNKRRREQKGRE